MCVSWGHSRTAWKGSGAEIGINGDLWVKKWSKFWWYRRWIEVLNQIEPSWKNQAEPDSFDHVWSYLSYSLSHFAPGEVDSWREWQRILLLRLDEMPGVFPNFKSLWSVEGIERMERPYQANDIYQVTKRHQFYIALSDFDVVVFHCIHDSMWQCCSARHFFKAGPFYIHFWAKSSSLEENTCKDESKMRLLNMFCWFYLIFALFTGTQFQVGPVNQQSDGFGLRVKRWPIWNRLRMDRNSNLSETTEDYDRPTDKISLSMSADLAKTLMLGMAQSSWCVFLCLFVLFTTMMYTVHSINAEYTWTCCYSAFP